MKCELCSNQEAETECRICDKKVCLYCGGWIDIIGGGIAVKVIVCIPDREAIEKMQGEAMASFTEKTVGLVREATGRG